ncbi:hypothetical protein MKA58_18785, partial [[Clostridium] innocuum]|nr:hypothetical protein [[Clostridium] innocuum]
VRKIYNESIKIESSTKDGNGAAAAYSGTKITATIENWSEEALTGRLKAYINEDTPVELTGTSIKDNTLTVTLNDTSAQGGMSAQDGRNIYVKLIVPGNSNLYVDESLKTISSGKNYKSGIIPFKSGVPISSESDFLSFMKAEGIYSAANVKCVITKNLNMTGYQTSMSTLRGSAVSAFAGELDGDFHTVNYLSNPLFYLCSGSSSSPAVIKNMIIKNAKITNDGTYGNGSTGIITINIGNYVEVKKLFLVQADLMSKFDTGFINGWTLSDQGIGYLIDECGSVGGSSKANAGAGSVGGLSGNPRNGNISNSYSIGTVVSGPTRASGLIGISGSTGVNIYAANKVTGGNFGSNGLDGGIASVTNAFYDSTITGITGKSVNGDGLSTKELIGNNLMPKFGTSLWNYKEGYYPRLNWIAGNPVADLYAATRGGFISVDGNTTTDQLFNGELYGTIKVPADLQKNGFSYSSSNDSVVKITQGGTIVPVGAVNSRATITIRYDDAENGGYASNTYDFTVKQTVKALASVSVSGTTNPGQKLTATASGASTYQWYKRKSGSTQRVAVPGATSSTYTLQPSDIGYEFNVDVGASGYATMSSGYTKAVTSVKPSGIDTSNIKDSSVDAMAEGIDGAEYEYAYATSETGNKIITHRSKDKVTISGLSRNKDYWLFTRVAGDENGSYEPSEWSDPVQIKTAKTDVVGPIKLNTNINAGSQLIANIADTNLQTGDWKLERVKDGSTTILTPTPAGDYGLTYMLTDADAGSVIRVSFTARSDSDFQGTVSTETKTILKRSQQAPAIAPTEIESEKEDHALVVKSTAAEADTRYEFGYRKDAKEEIKPLKGTYDAETKVTIPDLDRNTTYYVYMRKAGKDLYEPSAWSPSVQLTTERSSVAADRVNVTGTPKVNETITFKVVNETENTQDERGIWVLERIGDGMNNTLIPTTTSEDTKTITYQLVPEDAGYQIKATFIGTGDYK